MLKQYLKYATASVASFLVYSLYSLVDGLFVARGVGEYAMSGVNLALPYLNLLFSIAVLFAVGTGTLIAVQLGQNNRKEANRLFSQNTLVLLIFGFLLTVAVFLFLTPLTKLLGTNELTFAYTKSYLTGLAPFSVCFIISYHLEILIKTDGYPQKAFIAVTAGCLMNCLLDYLAVFVLKWGTFGAALATGLSQLFVCILYLCHFCSKKSILQFTRFSPDIKIYKKLLPLGLSDGITELMNGVMLFLYNRCVLISLGTDGLVTLTVLSYVNTLLLNCLIGFSAAAQPLVSYHLGKNEPKACRTYLKYALIAAGAFQVISYAILFFSGTQIAGAFISDSDTAVSATALALKQFGLGVWFMGLNVVIGGYCTAMEKPKKALLISVGRGLILPAPVLLFFTFFVKGSSVWFTPLLSEGLCLVVSILLLKYNRNGKKEADSGSFHG